MWVVVGGQVGSLYVMDDSSPTLTKLFANIVIVIVIVITIIIIIIPHRMII